MAAAEYLALVMQIDFDYLYTGTQCMQLSLSIRKEDIPDS
jgi:hypothetical protein